MSVDALDISCHHWHFLSLRNFFNNSCFLGSRCPRVRYSLSKAFCASFAVSLPQVTDNKTCCFLRIAACSCASFSASTSVANLVRLAAGVSFFAGVTLGAGASSAGGATFFLGDIARSNKKLSLKTFTPEPHNGRCKDLVLVEGLRA